MKITKTRLKEIIREELTMGRVAPGLGKDVRFTTVEARDDAMRGAARPGAGIEDIPQPEDEETRDRAFDSPEGRLVTLINAREALGKMTRDELKDLSMSLDADMVAALRHILANPMYKPLEESDEMELEEAATGYSELLRQGYSQATALAMASGSPAKKAEYDKLRKQGYGDSEARRFVYGRSYSAMGQR